MMPNLIKDRFKDWDILVVEDEPDSLEVASRWLRLAGAHVHSAANGKEGLDVARRVRPRFILSDLTMPVMDGWEMLYELKKTQEIANIPVIALTAHALGAIKEQTLQAGFVAHISKPLNPAKFIQQVVEIVESVPALRISAALDSIPLKRN